MVFSIACQNHDVDKNTAIPNGTYQGQYTRTGPLIKFSPSNVTVIFESGSFSGGSDRMYFPAICHGTYKISGQEIEFADVCVWTANFDPSLILSGKFELKIDGKRLVMSRSSGGQTDRYHLVLQ